MLVGLTVQNIVLIDRLELSLAAGLTALTGETGAGKSILIDALQLALGTRADAGVVREGAARTEVSAEFDCPGALAGWLEEAGFDSGEAAQEVVLLRRTVDA